MPDLEHFEYRNIIQMQDWVKQRLEACESQIKMWSLRLEDRAYFSSKQYVNYQIGKYTLEKQYMKYFEYLLDQEFNKLKKYKGENFKQIKL